MDNSLENYIVKHIKESIFVKKKILSNEPLLELIKRVSLESIETFSRGNKIILAGNGGSAADAQHIAAEFVSRFYFDRPGIPSIALTTDTSMITAIGNDYGFEKLFSRQIQANGNEGDMFIGISTSGNSPNIINGLIEAKNKKIKTIGLTGNNNGKMEKYCDFCLKVPSLDTPRIQESHILIGHLICGIVEEQMFGKKYKNK